MTILDHIKTQSLTKKLFVGLYYKTSDYIEIPFTRINNQQYKDEDINFLHGYNFVLEENIIIDLKDASLSVKIIEDESIEEERIKRLKNKIERLMTFKNEIDIIYSYDLNKILYNSAEFHICKAMLAFDFLSKIQLENNSYFEYIKNKINDYIDKVVKKHIKTLETEKELLKDDTQALAEVQFIIDTLNDIKTKTDLDQFKTNKELIEKGWPLLLAPNLFM